MLKRVITTISIFLLVSSGLSQNVPDSGSLTFHFKYSSQSQKSVLYLDYMQNKESMSTLMEGISMNRSAILEGRRYISIVPCIRRDQIQDAHAINRASEQASVVRAMVKTHGNIPHECIAFAIDTTQNVSNVVMVNVFDGELPQGNESGIIHYTSGGNYHQIFSMYPSGVPYGNLWMIQARAYNKY